MNLSDQFARPAIVSREDILGRAGCYLQLQGEDAPPAWTPNPKAATTFASMREAVRAAARLPAALRAYGVPRPAEVLTAYDYH